MGHGNRWRGTAKLRKEYPPHTVTTRSVLKSISFQAQVTLEETVLDPWGCGRAQCSDPVWLDCWYTVRRAHHGSEGRQPGNWRMFAVALEGCARLEHREETEPQSKILSDLWNTSTASLHLHTLNMLFPRGISLSYSSCTFNCEPTEPRAAVFSQFSQY